ncbi:NB-ARC domain-containing protein [Glycomyces albidus]|uniref:Tetratricopeptide repeat protein n=1 Tax=Glycomyces albidus TaxID=2656774 RepID=A0A6L5G4Q7_9ACTN|nr:tetratricopeptide repeat protein [Glycomyces albidus]MQM24618.1 tetratricopeptide repeat protein [Glycomyces albidus]
MAEPLVNALLTWAAQQLVDKTQDLAARKRQLGYKSPAVRRALLDAVKLGAADALTATFPDDLQRQEQMWTLLFERDTEILPLVSDIHPAEMPRAVMEWISQTEASSDEMNDPGYLDYSPVLAIQLCAMILTRIYHETFYGQGFLAEVWQEFEISSGFGQKSFSIDEAALSGDAQFQNQFRSPVNTIIQGQQFGGIHFHQTILESTRVPYSFDDGALMLGRIPSLAAAYQNRKGYDLLTSSLDDNDPHVRCWVISGMGGVGKTQLAAAFAKQEWNRGSIKLLIWADATNTETITAAFAEAGVRICGADPSDSFNASRSFLTWLSSSRVEPWLLVLDGLTDPTDMSGFWPPTSKQGLTLVTTRRRDAALDGHERRRLNVGLYSEEESIQFFTERFERNSQLLDGAAELAADLEYLPLALGQAAAFLLDQPGFTCNQFRRRLADEHLTLDQLSPEVLSADYPQSLAATLAISIDHAYKGQNHELVPIVLGLIGILNPAGIPAEIFTARDVLEVAASTLDSPDAGGHLQDETIREILVIISRLHRLNIIDHDGATIRMHSLIQRAIRDQLNRTDRTILVRIAADALADIWPDLERNPAYTSILRENVTNLRMYSGTELLAPSTHQVLINVGSSLAEAGQTAEAQAYFKRLYEECTSAFPVNHGSMFHVRNHLACAIGDMGDHLGARRALESLLEDELRVLGADDPSTLIARHNLASFQGLGGDPVGAKTAFEALLADHIRVLGKRHSLTRSTRHSLAVWQGKTGDPKGVAEALSAVLSEQLHAEGADHRDTFRIREDLAIWRRMAGDLNGSVAALEELLADQVRVQGPTHRNSIDTRHNLIHILQEAGNHLRAVELLEEQLLYFIREMGLEDLLSANPLASSIQTCDDLRDALERIIDIANHGNT